MDTILLLQRWSAPWLDALFVGVSWAGDAEFYTLLLPLIFWCAQPAFALRLGLVVFAAGWTQEAAKEWFATARPEDGVRLAYQGVDLGHAFPSGHTLTSTAFWGYLAARFRRRWLTLVAALAVLLVALSRVYLGVHWPVDVVGGMAIGGLLLAGFFAVEPRGGRWAAERGWAGAAALALAASVVLAFIAPGDMGVRIAGAGGGFAAGYAALRRLERGGDRHIAAAGPPAPSRPVFMRLLLRCLLGLAVLYAIRAGLGSVLPDLPAAHYVRYLAMGAWVALGPRLIVPDPPRSVPGPGDVGSAASPGRAVVAR